jgi:predicted ribosome quality control (RQC) complex YloA/Tae2 family protein
MPNLPAPSFDAVTLAAVAAELRALLPVRIGRVVQPTSHEVVLGVRGAGGLLLSADARWARVHLTEAFPQTELTAPFGQLLRARLLDAGITNLAQPTFERTLELHLHTLEGPYRLVAEPMGKHANLILVQDGTVVGALKVIGPHRSRLRSVLPGTPYATAPPDDRPRPGEVSPLDLERLLASVPGPLWRRLLATVAGIGPLLAYEMCARAGDPEAEQSDALTVSRLAPELEDLARRVRDADFDPRLYSRGEQIAYTPFPFVCLRGWRETATTVSRAIEQTVGARIADARREERRRDLLGKIGAALRRREGALEKAEQGLAQSADADRLRMFGELLLAYASQIPPSVDSVTLPDYEGRQVQISLDPHRTAIENAQGYFRRYAKARAAAKSLPERIAGLRDEVAYLQEAGVHVEHARADEDLLEIGQELADAGYLPRPRERRRVRAVAEPRTYQVDGFAVLVGRSSRDNDHVTFRLAAPEDLWFHARDLPGAHVILKIAGRQPDQHTIERVAAIAAYHSTGRASTAVDVVVTERRNVSKPKGARPGMVRYRGERTLRVRPAALM